MNKGGSRGKILDFFLFTTTQELKKIYSVVPKRREFDKSQTFFLKPSLNNLQKKPDRPISYIFTYCVASL